MLADDTHSPLTALAPSGSPVDVSTLSLEDVNFELAKINADPGHMHWQHATGANTELKRAATAYVFDLTRRKIELQGYGTDSKREAMRYTPEQAKRELEKYGAMPGADPEFVKALTDRAAEAPKAPRLLSDHIV